MNIKQKVVATFVTLGLLVSVGVVVFPAGALAQSGIPAGCPGSDVAGPPAPGTTCPDKQGDSTDSGQTPVDTNKAPDEKCTQTAESNCCGNVKTSIIGGAICKDSGSSDKLEDSTIWNILILVLNILTAGIGIAAVGGIVYGAILYTTAEDKPDQTKRAISIITNVVVGIIAYGLMYVILNYLIPGGVFS